MLYRLHNSTGSLVRIRTPLHQHVCSMHHSPRCAIDTPLRRPASPQRTPSLITKEQLLSIAARNPAPTSSLSTSSTRDAAELTVLIEVLPARVRAALKPYTTWTQLVEVVLDLGRPVVARFAQGAQILSQEPLTEADLEEVTSKACTYAAASCTLLPTAFHVSVYACMFSAASNIWFVKDSNQQHPMTTGALCMTF